MNIREEVNRIDYLNEVADEVLDVLAEAYPDLHPHFTTGWKIADRLYGLGYRKVES